MSTTPERTPGASGSTELEQLVSRLDELQRRNEALTAAFERSRTTRRVVMMAFLIFVVFSGWRFIALANMVRSPEYQKRLFDALQESAANNSSDYEREIRRLVKGITPVVSEAFSKQAAKDMPEFMRIFDDERKTLMTGLPQRLSQRVENHHHELLRRHQNLLQAEFPAVKNPEVRDRMMANACTALDRLVQKYYVDEFQREFQVMSDAWNEFPPADPHRAGEPPLEEQLMGELMDLTAVKLARHRAATK